MAKGLEIHYDILEIPGIDRNDPDPAMALSFRNDAMELIEAALEAQGLGEGSGAGIGGGMVSFGLLVEDWELAEAAVMAAVEGTEFDRIAAIERRDLGEDDGPGEMITIN